MIILRRKEFARKDKAAQLASTIAYGTMQPENASANHLLGHALAQNGQGSSYWKNLVDSQVNGGTHLPKVFNIEGSLYRLPKKAEIGGRGRMNINTSKVDDMRRSIQSVRAANRRVYVPGSLRKGFTGWQGDVRDAKFIGAGKNAERIARLRNRNAQFGGAKNSLSKAAEAAKKAAQKAAQPATSASGLLSRFQAARQ